VPSEWKKNTRKTKMLRNTCHDYISFKGGAEIPERKVRPPCGATRRLKRSSKFSEQEIYVIFKIEWSVGDINAQRILKLNVLMSHQVRLESF